MRSKNSHSIKKFLMIFPSSSSLLVMALVRSPICGILDGLPLGPLMEDHPHFPSHHTQS